MRKSRLTLLTASSVIALGLMAAPAVVNWNALQLAANIAHATDAAAGGVSAGAGASVGGAATAGGAGGSVGAGRLREASADGGSAASDAGGSAGASSSGSMRAARLNERLRASVPRLALVSSQRQVSVISTMTA
jgi:hypothetical protein